MRKDRSKYEVKYCDTCGTKLKGGGMAYVTGTCVPCQNKLSNKEQSEPRECLHCGTHLKSGYRTYELRACTYCFNSLDEYKEIKRVWGRLRFNKHWAEKHKKEQDS